jgi:hypothetical protein
MPGKDAEAPLGTPSRTGFAASHQRPPAACAHNASRAKGKHGLWSFKFGPRVWMLPTTRSTPFIPARHSGWVASPCLNPEFQSRLPGCRETDLSGLLLPRRWRRRKRGLTDEGPSRSTSARRAAVLAQCGQDLQRGAGVAGIAPGGVRVGTCEPVAISRARFSAAARACGGSPCGACRRRSLRRGRRGCWRSCRRFWPRLSETG